MVPLWRGKASRIHAAPLISARLLNGDCSAESREERRTGFTLMFAHPLLVPLAFVPLVWAALTWPRSRSRVALILKACSLAAIVLALSEPSVNLPKTRTATAVLVDTS